VAPRDAVKCSNVGETPLSKVEIFNFDRGYNQKSADELDGRTRFAIASWKNEETGRLKQRVEFAIGMKAMVVLNIATEAELANGTRGRLRL
jgi:hypothetical protein